MAALREMNHGDSVEIEVALPDLQPIECPLFSLLGTEWIFFFVKEVTGNNSNITDYSAYIKTNHKNSNVQIKPFKLKIRVDIMSGTKSIYAFREKYENVNMQSHRCMQISNMFMASNTPCNYSGWNFIKFSFTVFLPSEPVLKFKLQSQDKCEQNASHLNADAFLGSLSKDFSELLDSGLNHDVEIRCGEHIFKAHRLILCTRSKVFKTMLANNFREGQTGFVEIQDMDSSFFQDFIKFIYTDLLPELTFEKAVALYETGDKYDVRGLSMRCSEYLRHTLSPENVYRCLVLADAHSDEKLKTEAISYILNNKLDLQEEYWAAFSKMYPKLAFEMYTLARKDP